jgi:hypothetical protein
LTAPLFTASISHLICLKAASPTSLFSLTMILSRLSLLLVALSSSVESAAAAAFTPTRQCNQEFARVSVAQVQEVANLFIQRLSTSEAVASLARDNMFRKIQYDVVVSKVCGSCSSVFDESKFSTPDSTTSLFDKESYCFAGAHGYDATHSSLVFASLDPDTNQIVTGETRGLLYVSKMCNDGPSMMDEEME